MTMVVGGGSLTMDLSEPIEAKYASTDCQCKNDGWA
jgi:hypothetical protein